MPSVVTAAAGLDLPPVSNSAAGINAVDSTVLDELTTGEPDTGFRTALCSPGVLSLGFVSLSEEEIIPGVFQVFFCFSNVPSIQI